MRRARRPGEVVARPVAWIRRNGSKLLMMILALNLAAGMAVSVASLRSKGDRYTRGETLMLLTEDRLDLERSLIEGSLPAALDNPERLQAMRGNLERLFAGALEAAREIETIDASAGRRFSLIDGLEARFEQVDRALASALAGDDSAAAGLTGPEGREGFESLLSEARRAARYYGDEADTAARTADVESVLMMGLAALVTVLLLRKFQSARHGGELRAAEERSESEARFRSLVQNSSDVIMIVDEATTITYRSPSTERVLGYGDELVDTTLVSLAHPNDAARLTTFCGGLADEPQAGKSLEWRLKAGNGSWIQVETTGTNLTNDARVRGVVLTTRDIGERKKLEEQLRHQAFHDSLTNLANRALFADRVEHALARADRRKSSLAVLFLDVDDFKTVNDSLGHAAGDELLVALARRLQLALRPADTIARLGGDEFAVLLEDMRSESEAQIVVDRIVEQLEAPFRIGEREVGVSVSIGIARGDDREEGVEELLRNADVAMYMAKNNGKGRAETFEPTMHLHALERLELRGDLERAVAVGEFEVYYQPLVALDSGRITGMEALVRWNHPERGQIVPADFIPLAEETGLIVPLGRWVLQEACRQAVLWRASPGDGAAKLHVSVNISARQLQEPEFVEEVCSALTDSGLAPESLLLEITESALITDKEVIVERFHALKRLGVRLAIDDFGTGYSSLSYLSDFPVDAFKIDRSFLGWLGNTKESTLTAAIIKLGQTLGLEVVAEGIERPDQLAALRDLDCEMGQGFLFSKPTGAAGARALLAGADYDLTRWPVEAKESSPAEG
ncbi:MAG: putative bifunctional diguanylate cyclase/phosphodiesterase [Actinomycetota bacterium]